VNAVQRLSRITMICSEPDFLADFYKAAFGFVEVADVTITEPAFAQLIDIPGAIARAITLRLGGQEIELAGIQPPGRNYPRGVSGRSLLFQHFAIVVSDMVAAYARLSAHRGWKTISTDGPQSLPASSGGVTALKLRDPEGHPLELIAFPRDDTPAKWRSSSTAECLGIDHSAISVAVTERSVKFYERLGLRRTSGSLNLGPEQDKLDDVAGAQVKVTAMAPAMITPHVELLCYRGEFDRELTLPAANDVVATCLVMKVPSEAALEGLCAQNPGAPLSDPVRFERGRLRVMLRDPDGHLLCFETLP
jgi:catechol 2,3-dioxygenase-like lactoylglutathione lyase family enzyme